MDNAETQAQDTQGLRKVGVPPPPDLPAELLATVIADVESRSSIVFDHTLQFKKQFPLHSRQHQHISRMTCACMKEPFRLIVALNHAGAEMLNAHEAEPIMS